ncbi:hypothetical protein HG535_0A05380 [Zygotorulaspora mrakii]|uniref:Cytochrome c oxidase copper chaperone n=1 Tax=Zygotorulaspora mrakii TaxID=42260 RepID=A0A7H9AWS7_ZYGMR|nr:uncharacterized protein HG535_0A05380 [Zygotorulaspora mrakii]QLG70597.1 hypothetical protein HG535_0A05380 [Zygotorulaspora mrakii]
MPGKGAETKNNKEDGETKPKPCCVCLPEKDERDQCILFNGQDSDKCEDVIQKYKTCMKTYGFDI